jgi:predicted RNase H-like nuclease/ppGpp synthetase/RelA/SpoT-type nucleotidyltranferase
MYAVGVDLAWGQRRPTGIAVLDADGALVRLATVQGDEDIDREIAAYVEGPCLVAIDAPLVVANRTGNRPAEAALNRDFARFDAGAHPSNTGKPELAGTPRGAALAARFGLDLDPASRAPRRAIEVYPHAATVALFRLGRTLKYKNKKGRSPESMRAGLLELTALLEGLEDADPALHLTRHEPWKQLVALVEGAQRKSELRVAEDQVDAVVCAYVARYAGARPDDLTVYGDAAGGAIVTPTLPEDLEPEPRPRRAPSPEPCAPGPVSDQERADALRAAVATYAAAYDDVVRSTEEYARLVTDLLDDAGINYLSVTGRPKSVASFAAKAHREAAGRPVFLDPLTEITDVVGVRVITYLRRDVAAVAELLRDALVVLDDRDMGRETAREGRFGYASRHLLVEREGDRAAQVQVRTVLQHAWAEFEHAMRYKGAIPDEQAPDLDRRFTLAAGLLELADREFSAIHETLRRTGTLRTIGALDDDPRIGGEELATFLTERYSEAGWSRPDHYSWISGLLLELGITSVEELGALLDSVDPDEISERMAYRYPPGAVRRLDDALLVRYGQQYVDLHGNAHRRESLQARWGKLNG